MNTQKFEKEAVRVIAHRGLSGIERENTNAAFVAAGNRSYYGIETDIHRTADGRFVICHDLDLFRVSGEKIPVEEVSMSVLQNVILFDKDDTKDRADLRPGTLENYINICKKYEKHSILEMKTQFTDEEIAQIVAIIRELDYLEHVTFISFCYENLEKIRAILPEQSAQYLFREITDEVIDTLAAAKIDVDVKYTALTEENVKKIHEAGLKINCWTVDSPEDAERLVQMGVDFITTNILE